MPPTIKNGATPEKRPVRPGDRRSDFICRVKYCNTLPDIPFDTKFIQYPFNPNRFIEYKQTSLEKNYKYEVLTEHDLGVNIDLINKDAYTIDYNAVLDPKDEKLLEEDNFTPQDSKRSRHHARSVSWLRRTEYISTEQTRFQPQTMEKVEAKVGFSIKKSFKDEVLYMDRDSQIRAIEKTFEDVKKPITTHPSKPNVTAVQVHELFPDFKMWKYPFAQVLFDSDPARPGRSVAEQNEEMSQAMIRGVMDEEGNQFVAYFLPTEETLEKRKQDFINKVDYVDDEAYEYKIARDYNWNVKNKASKGYEENYLIVMRNDGVYYNELETRVRLTKRRQPGQALSFTRLVLKHRPTDAAEFKNHRTREKQLEPPGEEEEEDEDEEDEEDEEEEKEEEKEGEGEKEDREKKSDDEEKGSDDEKKESDEEKRSDDEEKGSDDEVKRSDDEAKGSDDEEKGSDEEVKRSDDEAKGSDDEEKGSDDEAKRSDDEEKKSDDDEKMSYDDEKKSDDDEKKSDDDEKKSDDDEKKSDDDENMSDDDLDSD